MLLTTDPIDAKTEFDTFVRTVPRSDRGWRLSLWRDFMAAWDKPLRSPALTRREYDPRTDSARQWKRRS